MTEKIAPPPVTISVDINSVHVTGALVRSDGILESLFSAPTPVDEGSDAILQTLIALCQHLIEQADIAPIVGIGVSTVGLVHHTNGTIIYADNSLPALQDISLTEILQAEFRLPTYVENNVNAMAIAESNLGAGQGCNSLFYIHADVALNGALMQNGRIWRGMHSSSGQLGHLLAGWMAERPVNLSQRASGEGIASEYNMRSRKFRHTGINEIIQYARHGDQLAIRVIRDGAHVLGAVVSPIVSLIDPERVVVGGLLMSIGELWWKTLQDTLRQNPLPALRQVEIEAAQLNEHAALIGAGLLAHERAALHS